MKVNRLSDNRILIVLCEQDMRDFSLDYKTLSLNDNHSRRIMLRLLQVACRKEGIRTDGQSLSIEALSLERDCYILVTVSGKSGRKYRLKQSNRSLCYNLGNSTNFLDTINSLYIQNVCCNKNSAYFLDGEYYLIFDYPVIPKKLRRVLSEYATKCRDEYLSTRLREGGKEICKTNAIMQIGKLL